MVGYYSILLWWYVLRNLFCFSVYGSVLMILLYIIWHCLLYKEIYYLQREVYANYRNIICAFINLGGQAHDYEYTTDDMSLYRTTYK